MGKLPFFRTKPNTSGSEYLWATIMTSDEHTERIVELERTLQSVRVDLETARDEVAGLVADDFFSDVLSFARATLADLESKERELLAGIERAKARRDDALTDEERRRLVLKLREYFCRLGAHLGRLADIWELRHELRLTDNPGRRADLHSRLQVATVANAEAMGGERLGILYEHLRNASINVAAPDYLEDPRRGLKAIRSDAEQFSRWAQTASINEEGEVLHESGETIIPERIPPSSKERQAVEPPRIDPHVNRRNRLREIDHELYRARLTAQQAREDRCPYAAARQARVEQLEATRRELEAAPAE